MYLIHISNLRNTYLEMVVFHLMHMCMSISSKGDNAHVHSFPIILYASSAHVQCVKVMESDTIKLLDKS